MDTYYIGYICGYVVGSLIRTAVILAVYTGILKIINKPVAQKGSYILGIFFFAVVTAVPVIISLNAYGTIAPVQLIIDIVIGLATGFFVYLISYRINRTEENKYSEDCEHRNDNTSGY